ncbi:hypothetical protein Gpo141_00003753 [Globisporangium polare]
MAASPRLSSDELEMDILQGIFAGWDPEYDIHSACSSSSSISVSMSPHESLSIESLTKCATASRAVETLTKRRSSSTDKTKPKLASSSARQKHEKHRLQREAHELSEKLRRLQESARVSWLKRDDELPTSSKLVVSPAWKTVAKTHRDQLQQAQSGNQQLKLQSLEHKKLAKNLRRALCKRMTQNERLANTLLLPPLHRLEADASPDDRTVLQDMIASVNVMHVNVDNVYWALKTQVPATKLSSGSFRKWDVHFDTSMSTFVGVIDCEEVPFRKVEVENAMALLRDRRRPGSRRYSAEDFGGSPDMAVSQSLFRHAGPLETAIYRSRYASRFFEDGDRSVSVSISIIDSVDGLGQAAPGLTLKAQTWTVLTEQEPATRQSEKAMTLIQTYTTVTPVKFREPCAFRWEKELVEKHFIPEWDRGICAGHQSLENALLDQQVTR